MGKQENNRYWLGIDFLDNTLNWSYLPADVFFISFSDITLANILSPQSDACGTKFELTVDEVLFVGHPMLAYKKQNREFKVTMWPSPPPPKKKKI